MLWRVRGPETKTGEERNRNGAEEDRIEEDTRRREGEEERRGGEERELRKAIRDKRRSTPHLVPLSRHQLAMQQQSES